MELDVWVTPTISGPARDTSMEAHGVLSGEFGVLGFVFKEMNRGGRGVKGWGG